MIWTFPKVVEDPKNSECPYSQAKDSPRGIDGQSPPHSTWQISQDRQPQCEFGKPLEMLGALDLSFPGFDNPCNRPEHHSSADKFWHQSWLNSLSLSKRRLPSPSIPNHPFIPLFHVYAWQFPWTWWNRLIYARFPPTIQPLHQTILRKNTQKPSIPTIPGKIKTHDLKNLHL